MVLLVVKPRRFAAACCSVEVIKGADGRDTDCLVFKSASLNCAALSALKMGSACSLLVA
jgi:hypothetical protein